MRQSLHMKREGYVLHYRFPLHYPIAFLHGTNWRIFCSWFSHNSPGPSGLIIKISSNKNKKVYYNFKQSQDKTLFSANALMSTFMASNIFTRCHMQTFWNTAKVFPGWIIFLIDISLYDARFIITFNRFLKTVCFCWCIWKREIFSPY